MTKNKTTNPNNFKSFFKKCHPTGSLIYSRGVPSRTKPLFAYISSWWDEMQTIAHDFGICSLETPVIFFAKLVFSGDQKSTKNGRPRNVTVPLWTVSRTAFWRHSWKTKTIEWLSMNLVIPWDTPYALNMSWIIIKTQIKNKSSTIPSKQKIKTNPNKQSK